MPGQQVAHPMIRAQLTLPDGKTPGAMRQGSDIILTCIAAGCRIVPNPLNRIPHEWHQYVLRADEPADVDINPIVGDAPQQPKRGRGRPRKVKTA
jgi:hypothetical protein